MYSKEEISKIKSQFWTSFGQYMKPIPGATGGPVNWINYKTGIRNIHFRMEADIAKAIIAIEISHSNKEERSGHYNKFLSLKNLLTTTTGSDWEWNENFQTSHSIISSISQQLDHVNILNRSDWPSIITFLKTRIIGLDEFWEMVKEGFE